MRTYYQRVVVNILIARARQHVFEKLIIILLVLLLLFGRTQVSSSRLFTVSLKLGRAIDPSDIPLVQYYYDNVYFLIFQHG